MSGPTIVYHITGGLAKAVRKEKRVKTGAESKQIDEMITTCICHTHLSKKANRIIRKNHWNLLEPWLVWLSGLSARL